MSEKLPILYCLQMHPEGRTQAMELASLMADIEPEPQTKMGFMFCLCRGCVMDTGVEMKIRAKFPDTRIYKCQHSVAGWPKGPNATIHEVYSMFSRQCNTERPDRWQYAAIMMGEPDCVPLTKDWISRIWTEWHECNWNWPGGNRQLVLGYWLAPGDSDCGFPHINGNCLLSPEFIRRYPTFTQTTFGAWDTTHSRALMQYGRPSKEIFSDYNIGGTDPRKPWPGCQALFKPRVLHGPFPILNERINPCYLHGVKDQRGIGCVRTALNINPPSRDRFTIQPSKDFRGIQKIPLDN